MVTWQEYRAAIERAQAGVCSHGGHGYDGDTCDEIPAPVTFVQRADDDSPCPLTGLVLGHEDDERVTVAWGDAAYSDDPEREARTEWVDELTPVRS